MNKIKVVIYAPVDTFSGYGANSREKVKALYELYKDSWDIKILACRWGATPWGFIDSHEEEWGFLKPMLLNSPQLPYQPDVMIWITVPNEFQKIGKVNIGFTAGIETTVCDGSWIEGLQRMDLVIVPSEHSKKVFETSKFLKQNPQTGQQEKVEATIPIKVVFEGSNIDIYKPLNSKDITNIDLGYIKEKFCFLFVGHYLGGVAGEDRKNVSLLIKAFYETFKNKTNPPALILKTSCGASSYMDRREILRRINDIRKSVNSKIIPSIYLLQGDFTDGEMNELYNHPKVKAMVSLTKGEGYGKPLLEFSMVNKPIIASNWSGHVDFLDPEFSYLINGELKNVHPSAVVPNMILAESQWFSPYPQEIGQTFRTVFENYKDAAVKGKRLGFKNRKEFNWNVMKDKMKVIFDEIDSKIPRAVALKLPSLKRIELPKLTRIESQK
jgi:hypothetical protein